jgi:2-keto-4-pentenoate hydratase/2-oxohepta-3-ene-1,7-dioic acid hydratase in catechol pathway
MTLWIRCKRHGVEHIATLEGPRIALHGGSLFDRPQPTGLTCTLDDVELLMPCQPGKFIGLWNNFHERAQKENLQQPDHPLYFLKSRNSYAAHGAPILRPAGYGGAVVFEAELGIVIGHRCKHLSVADAPSAIFGYTCVNDVTARDLMRLDPAFVQWTRAKGFDSFGIFGPAIATGLDPATLRVKAYVGAQERQNYPVADMFFSPAEIVSRLSQDMTLEAGDLIACGTSVGAGPLQDGETVEIVIEGIGRLANHLTNPVGKT